MSARLLITLLVGSVVLTLVTSLLGVDLHEHYPLWKVLAHNAAFIGLGMAIKAAGQKRS